MVDDHALFAEGMHFLVEECIDGAVCVLASSAEEGLRILDETLDVDLILLDLAMPGIDGLGFLAAVRNRNLALPVALLSACEDVQAIKSALDRGVVGYIPKSLDKAEFVKVFAQVLAGEVYLPHAVAAQIARISRRNGRQEPYSDLGLTRRQFDVLKLMNMGYSNKDIANTLFVAEETVKFHIKALFRTFHARNRTDCILIARAKGLFPDTA